MEKIPLRSAAKMTSPNPITLVSTLTPEGKTNLAAVSWWMYASFNPGTLCFAMGKGSYSGELVRQNKEVVLAMPGAEIADAAFKCGTVSGRNADKAKEFAIDMQAIPGSSIQIPVHTRLAMACSLDSVAEADDHFIYICKMRDVFADTAKTQIFAWDGYSRLAPLP